LHPGDFDIGVTVDECWSLLYGMPCRFRPLREVFPPPETSRFAAVPTDSLPSLQLLSAARRAVLRSGLHPDRRPLILFPPNARQACSLSGDCFRS